MDHFRLLSVDGSVWPPVCDGASSQIWSAFQQLRQTQWSSPSEIECGQLGQARRLIAHCEKHVPYYRDLFAREGIRAGDIKTLEDFRGIPTLPRRVYQERHESFVAEALPAGTLPTTISNTSGSSGSPTRVYNTNLVHLWWCSFFLRDLEWGGIDPRGKIASIRSTGKQGSELTRFMAGVNAPSWLPALQSLIEMGTSHIMDIGQDPRVQMRWLRNLAPSYLASYPGNLLALAEYVESEGPITGLRAIQSISDTLHPDDQARIEAAFGAPVKNTYSCAEAGYLASSCPLEKVLHIHAENVVLEVLDQHGRPCAEGETGSVHVTALHNFRGPLIRYEIGDQATVAKGPCRCGRGLTSLALVRGKESPLFTLPNGSRKNSARLAFQIRKAGGHWQHQVIQRAANRVVVRIIPTRDWTPARHALVEEAVTSFFEAPILVEIELCERLIPPSHGKIQNMIVETGE